MKYLNINNLCLGSVNVKIQQNPGQNILLLFSVWPIGQKCALTFTGRLKTEAQDGTWGSDRVQQLWRRILGAVCSHLHWLRHGHPTAFPVPSLNTQQVKAKNCIFHQAEHCIETVMNSRKCWEKKVKKSCVLMKLS